MNSKTIRLSAILGATGLALAAGAGWLAFGPHSSQTAAPASSSALVLSSVAPATRSSATAPAAGQRYALLVGVGAYQHADGEHLSNLAGPPEDARAMAQVLGNGWEFDSIAVLQDAEATRANILQKLDELTRVAEPGSHVLFYYSGHGTSPQDPNLGLPLPHATGALLAHDSRVQGDSEAVVASLIVGRRDLRPRFEALDRKGVYATALIDACYSENATRARRQSRRHVAMPALDPGAFGSGSLQQEPYPYRQVATLAASGANQTALDIDDQIIRRFPTLDGKPHGAFTDALLRALRDRALPEYGSLDKNADQQVSVEEFFAGASQFMARRQYDHAPMLQPTVAEMSARTPVRQLALFHADGAAQPRPAAPTDLVRPASRLRVAFAGAPPPLADLDAIEWVSADADLTLEPEGAGYALYDAAGLRVGAAGDRAALREQLRRRAELERLATAAQHAGRTTVSLALAASGATTRLPLGSADHPVQTRLMLAADQTGYPLVFDLSGDGAVRRLYPYYPEEAQRRWSAGAPLDVLCVKTAPPTGVDVVYAFWLAEPWPSAVLERTQRIAASDAGAFDVVQARLKDSAKVLGATRLTVEIYPQAPGELKAWTATCEK